MSRVRLILTPFTRLISIVNERRSGGMVTVTYLDFYIFGIRIVRWER